MCPTHCKAWDYEFLPKDDRFIPFEGSECPGCEAAYEAGMWQYGHNKRRWVLAEHPELDPKGTPEIQVAQLRSKVRGGSHRR